MNLSFERVIEFAADLIRIPGLPGSEGQVADRLVRELRHLQFDEVWTDPIGNVIGRIQGNGSAPAVMLSSHLDMVDVGDPAGWEYPPFAGVVADGFLHGRGAMDIKGPLAIQTYAAAQFCGARPPGDILVAHTVYEERGGWGMQELLESGSVRPDVVLIGESTAGDICIGHRGRAELIVQLSGRAGHASAPERAVNPLYALGPVLAAIEDFARQLPADPVLGPSTLAPTEVQTLPASPNVIPDRVRVTLDWRVLPGWSADQVLQMLTDFLLPRLPLPEGCSLAVLPSTETQRSYTGIERDRQLFSPGFLLPTDHPLARIAASAVAPSLGRTPAIRPWTFATDGGHTCGVHGIPTIGFAPGEERYAHTNRERLDLRDAAASYAAYPALIRAIQHEYR